MDEKEFEELRNMPQKKWASAYLMRGEKPEWLQKIIDIETEEFKVDIRKKLEEVIAVLKGVDDKSGTMLIEETFAKELKKSL